MTLRAAWPLLALALTALGCGSPVVGAECAPGTTRCGDRCFDLDRDPDHCGSCEESCGRFECVDAQCGPGLRDAGADGGALLVDGGEGLPFLPDGGFGFPDVTVGRGCKLGYSACGDDCIDLRSDLLNCGECGMQCPAGKYCALGACRMCDVPLRLCAGVCVDMSVDPSNCGGCANVCRSGICEGGRCADVLTGHLVVIGHDYANGRPSATAMRLVGNAIFLASGSPVRTLVYEGTGSTASIDGVTAAIDFVVAKDGRTWAPFSAAEEHLGAELVGADALLVHAQHGSTDAELRQLGQRLGLALSQFLLRGGVIVVLETPDAENAGTFRVLEPAGLFEAESRVRLAPQTLTVAAPGVGVAARTTRTYRAPNPSVHFEGITSPGMVVVRDAQGEAVVFHRVVAP